MAGPPRARDPQSVLFDFETARRLFTLICVLHWKGQDA
jgi:uncharacterized protein (UPF0262 family)